MPINGKEAQACILDHLVLHRGAVTLWTWLFGTSERLIRMGRMAATRVFIISFYR